MKVWVLANDAQKEEILSLPVDDIVILEWLQAIPPAAIVGTSDAVIDLLFVPDPRRVAELKNLPASLVMVNSVVNLLPADGTNLVRFNGWPTFLERPVTEASCNNQSQRIKAEDLWALFGRRVEWVTDIAGFVTPRVVSSVINEAFFALEEGVSSAEEIDTAMRLGTNYPFGPFEWGKKIGLANVYNLLETLARQQSRYQPSVLLKQTALA